MSKPFEFGRVTLLVEMTPLRAASLDELLTGMTLASELSIFYHLHQWFFRDPERLLYQEVRLPSAVRVRSTRQQSRN